MQPLNPFLGAFFKSSLPAQCSPTAHHILLVPTTDVLLTSRDTDSGASFSDLIGSEEFLASHVLRIPGAKPAAVGGKDAAVPNLREMRGKAKPYNTINSRSVVIKDNLVYSNKGFKTLTHANLLNDAIWYSDTLEPKPWLIYYISRPLVGSWEEVKITPAVPPDGRAKTAGPGATGRSMSPSEAAEPNSAPRKKDIKSFHDLLNHFPVIARQMQPGLEKIFREFTTAFERPLPPPPSSSNIPDPEPDGPIASAMKRARSNSASAKKALPAGQASAPPIENFYAEDDEDVMRASLETAVTTAIDLFQNVDKQQLSLLGATTDLTGPVVERLIERYVTENLHHLIFPRLSALKRQDDLELEAKIRQMEFIDISQLGITIQGGLRGKHELTITLGRAVEEFRKMSAAMSPQQMMESLLSTLSAVTQLADVSDQADVNGDVPTTEKPLQTVNADTLVSLLLFVVIRAQLRHLQARFIYVRHFIFIDDVDSGEMGYALSTFEAVISYLVRDSAGLRRASRRNKALWDAAAAGNLSELRRIMEPSSDAIDDDDEEEEVGSVPEFESGPEEAEWGTSSRSTSRPPSSGTGWSSINGAASSRRSTFSMTDRFSLGSGLGHVFPFQSQEIGANDVPHPPLKRIKRVAMDTRSMSSGSEISYRSRATSIGTLGSGFEGDTSIERLSRTQDSFGQSVLMMAVQNERPEALRFLLSLKAHFPPDFVLEDINHENTTLLSAAVQLGHEKLISIVLDFLTESPEVGTARLQSYFALQDIWGRSVAHYLFHARFLIASFGRMMPWRQKDKNGQTPLFALCRSYDHADYHDMVEDALEVAAATQEDGRPLHIDDHVDAKGNTLLHIVNDAQLALRILQRCDVDVNATNDKKFTPLMVASKYGRFDMVRVLFGDPRVDVAAKELRGLTAVELAKDDEVRNKIDDLTLFSMPSGPESRTTAVVRSYFVEDASIRFVLKSGAPVDKLSYAVTTCRRSLTDFEHLAKLLAVENPASWIPSIEGLRSPFQIPAKPSRAALKDLQMRMDWFLRIMLTHPTFATHEMLWEFFLVPDLQLDMMEQRSKLKAETRVEKVRDEMEPLENVREVEQFVDHAREMIRSVNYSTKSVARRANNAVVVTSDLHDAALLLHRAVATLAFLPRGHVSALEVYVRTLAPTQSNPHALFQGAFLAIQSTIEAILGALARPPKLIGQINASKRQVERNYNSMSRSTRWPLGLLDDARQRLNEEREGRARQSQMESENLSKELRYTQQTVAGELAGWQDMHERIGRRAIRELAKGMLVQERMRLDGMKRALRRVKVLGGQDARAKQGESDMTHWGGEVARGGEAGSARQGGGAP